MKTRDIIIGLVVLVILITGALLIRNARNSKVQNLPIPTPNIQTNLENRFPGLAIPANADRATLSDVTGGQGMGEAWRTFENGQFSLTVVADLPPYSAGHFYQGWISNGSSTISLGGLGASKGGFIVNFASSSDYRSYNKVFVTSETVFDSTPETHVLEGSF